MSKPFKLLSAFALCVAALLSVQAEPAALGKVGVGSQEVNTGNLACLSCSESAKGAPGAASAKSVGGANGNVTAFSGNNGAGYAVLNGGDIESALNGKDPVPEPATIGLVGAGLAALAFGLKRRS